MRGILILYMVGIVCGGCFSDAKLGVQMQSVSSIYSKQDNLLVSEYRLIQDRPSIIASSISEAWAEYGWTYKNRNLEKQRLDILNFIIKFKSEPVDEIKCMRTNGGPIGYSNDKIFFSMDQIEKETDTLTLKLVRGSDTTVVYFKKV